MQENLEVLLLDKLEELNEIQCINSGGCGIVVVALQNWLHTTCNVESEIIYLFHSSSIGDYENLNKNKIGSCLHAVIKVRDCYYDTKGKYPTKDELHNAIPLAIKKSMVVPIELATKTIKSKHHWNPQFNRQTGIRKINKILNTKVRLSG